MSYLQYLGFSACFMIALIAFAGLLCGVLKVANWLDSRFNEYAAIVFIFVGVVVLAGSIGWIMQIVRG